MGTEAVLKALAEPRRAEILRIIRDGPRSVGEIARHFDVTQQAVSLHLRVLRDAELVAVRKDGQRRLYEIRTDGIRELEAFLQELWPTSLERLKRVVEADGG